jgi:poly-gamma-glutamate capsule biosynthesis protein CapA/YwtB (metallophosphatase superfamily)
VHFGGRSPGQAFEKTDDSTGAVTIRWIALVFAVVFARGAFAASAAVPIYIEDSHAGSFYWLAEHLDLDEECTLIHFDAHSDASAIFDSDELRSRLRRVGSWEERRQLLDRWRETGVVQCFNWIEPLMPAPISNLIWVRSERVGKARAGALAKEAAEYLDGQLEASPRSSGSLAKRCRVLGLGDLRANIKEGTPVVITIDLDYFAKVQPGARNAAFERMWKFVAGCRNLRAVTFAISRPYLSGDEQADALVRLALAASLSLPTARIQFEPFEKVGNDRSLRARELRKKNREVPSFGLTNASEELRALILANRDRINVSKDAAAWAKLLGQWENEAPTVRLAIKDHDPSTDNIWRVPVSEPVELELQTEPWDAAVRRVEWIAVAPENVRCNLTAERADEPGFARGAPPRPRWRETTLRSKDGALPIDALRDFFDRKTGCGAIRLKARAELNHHIRETPAIEIRRFAGSGFRAAIMEQFGLPYLFGSGEMRDGTSTGPETGWGADCANFVVYALRRQGRQIPWCNPKQLRKYLEPLVQNVEAGAVNVSEEDMAEGLVVHFGSHVAVVMEDRPPIGTLDRNDLVAHQLEGVPEMISLGELLAKRNNQRFDLLRVPHHQHQADLVVGGDVMLGRSVGEKIQAGADPFADIREDLDRAPWKFVNLECVVSDKGTATAEKPYCLRAPIQALGILTAARINAVGLANNHAGDFGSDALSDSIARLKQNDIAVVGAAETQELAYAPHFFTAHDGKRVGLIALSDLENQRGGPAVATAFDRERVAGAIAEARAGASFVLCFMHWGDENTPRVAERQRELARWLIDHEVDAVVGCHSHCLQPLDFYHGRPIIYSLGNLVFDGAQGLESWNQGALLEVAIGRTGTDEASIRLVPVRLDTRGFPHTADDDQALGKIPATTGAAFSRNRVQGASKKR